MWSKCNSIRISYDESESWKNRSRKVTTTLGKMKNGKVLELNKIAFVMLKGGGGGGGGGEIVFKWFRRIANVFLLKAKCQRINREPLQ